MPFFNNSHINKPLTNISAKYTNTEFIANNIFPKAKVGKESDLYYIYDGSNLQVDETIRANRAESNEVGMNFSTSSYVLEEHALKELISDRDRDNADAPLSLDTDVTEHLTEKIMLRKEVETMKIAFTTTSWGNNATIGSAGAWDTSTSNPIADVLTATASVLLQGVTMPNAGAMGWEVFKKLKVNSVTVDRIRTTTDRVVTAGLLAALFDLDELNIGKTVYNPNAEGIAASNTFIWGKDMLIYFKSKRPALRSPSAGYMLTIGGKGVKVKKWREEKRAGDYVEVSTMFTPHVVASSSAFLLKQVVV